MGQKRVSFKVAEAIKEAGFPQGNLQGLHKTSFPMYYKDDYIPDYEYFYLNYIDFIDKDLMSACPTYLDVWLWLWREKKIKIEPVTDFATYIKGYEDEIQLKGYEDPEEAIIVAIDYLVDNNLIK